MAFLLVDVCDISGTNHSLKVFLQQFQKHSFSYFNLLFHMTPSANTMFTCL